MQGQDCGHHKTWKSRDFFIDYTLDYPFIDIIVKLGLKININYVINKYPI